MPPQSKRAKTTVPSPPAPSESPPGAHQYDSDGGMAESDQELFEYESDIDEADYEDFQTHIEGEEVGQLSVEGAEEASRADDGVPMDTSADALVISDEEEELLPPPETSVKRGKLSSRKQYMADVDALCQRYASAHGEQVINFRKDSDETVTFTLLHPAFKRGLKLVLMNPDLGGYPHSHQTVCYSESEIAVDVASVLEEVPSLPPQADRSVSGVVQYLISRLILNQPSPFQLPQLSQDDSDEDYEYDDELYGIGGASSGQSFAMLAALRSDFKEILAAGYRPGFTRVSDLDHVVSVSKKVNTLGVPLEALQAWDASLITGEVRYLVLLMNFGSKYPVDPDNGTRGEVRFKMGLSPKYKPSKQAIAAAFRSHSANTYTNYEFEAISLSAPLDALFLNKFQEILLTRRRHVNLGWAGAEYHCLTPGRVSETLDKRGAKAADKEEQSIAGSYTLPKDPMGGNAAAKTSNNYPLLAYSYLVRRFVTCPRFCLNCYKKIESGIVALKPFVCDSPLCLFQLIQLGLGPSLEHEIKSNAPAVDLLIQLAYSSAKESYLTMAMQPQGLGLEVPRDTLTPWKVGDPTVDFDTLDVIARNAGMAALIMELPPVPEMKSWLNGDDLSDTDKSLGRNRKLQEMKGGTISNSAWKLLRWIVASNTSYLKQIEDDDELVQGVPRSYRQFRLVVGDPAKEHLLAENVKIAKETNVNARTYPTLYAWHGSAVKNWHSILREGLHFKATINGRAHGHGVYFAKQGEISLGSYAQHSNSVWKNAEFGVGKCAAICEIVNLPDKFVSTNPYFVINKLDWIQCRYLIIQRTASYNYNPTEPAAVDDGTTVLTNQLTRPVPLDPAHPITLNAKPISVPDLLPKLQAISKKLKDTKEELSHSDTELLKEPVAAAAASDTPVKGRKRTLTASSTVSQPGATSAKPAKVVDPFVPCSDELVKLIKVLPPPSKPNQAAVQTITRELRNMMKEEEELGPTACGFHFDFERSNDSLFTWIVEFPAGSFDQTLPLIKDMKAKGVTSLLFEIRFGESFPFSPPFFRLVYPRFLPFIAGGGGHITGGGSICMDLLTASGWMPSYTLSPILLQIRMAISNLDPRPARLDPNSWATPYTMVEAVAGFERAAATHGWKLPSELAQLTRQY